MRVVLMMSETGETYTTGFNNSLVTKELRDYCFLLDIDILYSNSSLIWILVKLHFKPLKVLDK